MSSLRRPNNRNCCVHRCSSKASRERDVSFHSFPSPNGCKVRITNKFGCEEITDRRRAWMKALKLKSNKKISSYTKVCSLHFRREDFFPSLLYDVERKRRVLKKNAVPSLNLPGRSHETTTARRPKEKLVTALSDLGTELSTEELVEMEIQDNESTLFKVFTKDGRVQSFDTWHTNDGSETSHIITQPRPVCDDYSQFMSNQHNCIYVETSSLQPDDGTENADSANILVDSSVKEHPLIEDVKSELPDDDIGEIEDEKQDISELSGIRSIRTFRENSANILVDSSLKEHPLIEDVRSEMPDDDIGEIEEEKPNISELSGIRSIWGFCEDSGNISVDSSVNEHPIIENVKSEMPDEVISEIEDEKPDIWEISAIRSIRRFCENENRFVDVCRICFESILNDQDCVRIPNEDDSKIDENQSPFDDVRHMLGIALPALDLNMCRDSVLCASCHSVVIATCRMRERWQQTEEIIKRIVTGRNDDDVITMPTEHQEQEENCHRAAEYETGQVVVGTPAQEGDLQGMENEIISSVQQFPSSYPSNETEQQQQQQQQHRPTSPGNIYTIHSYSTRKSHQWVPENVKRKFRDRKMNKGEWGKGPYVCDECGLTFSKVFQLQNHMFQHHRVKKAICEICGVSLTRSQLHYHIMNHMRPHKCNQCTKSFSSRQVFEKHFNTAHSKSHTKPYQCRLCGKGYFEALQFRDHMRIHNTSKHTNTQCVQKDSHQS